MTLVQIIEQKDTDACARAFALGDPIPHVLWHVVYVDECEQNRAPTPGALTFLRRLAEQGLTARLVIEPAT